MRSAQRTGVTPRNVTTSPKVQVTRDWGGLRVTVDATKLRAVHMATDTGGRRKQLPHPMLAAYVDCSELGEVPWHARKHGGYPHGVKILIARTHNDAAVYQGLRSSATVFKGGRRRFG